MISLQFLRPPIRHLSPFLPVAPSSGASQAPQQVAERRVRSPGPQGGELPHRRPPLLLPSLPDRACPRKLDGGWVRSSGARKVVIDGIRPAKRLRAHRRRIHPRAALNGRSVAPHTPFCYYFLSQAEGEKERIHPHPQGLHQVRL
jgi:hypothetical protein